jgi:hypothetical protein
MGFTVIISTAIPKEPEIGVTQLKWNDPEKWVDNKKLIFPGNFAFGLRISPDWGTI